MSENIGNSVRTDEETHGIVMQTGSRAIAKGRNTKNVTAGNDTINVRVPDLKRVDTVININIYTNGASTDIHGPVSPRIDGNVVGMTVYDIGAGCTMTAEVVAAGSL